MKLIKTLTAAAAGICCTVITSQATLVLPVATDPTALGATFAIDTSSLVTTLVSGFTSTPLGAFSGSITTQVYQESLASNPLGGYTFLYTIANSGPDTLAHFSVDGWSSALPNVVVGNTGAGINASTGYRSVNGDVVGFNWSALSGIVTGGTAYIFVQTGIRQYTTDNATVADGGSATVLGYAVPEPTTMVAGAMLLLPFGMSTLRMLRRNRAV